MGQTKDQATEQEVNSKNESTEKQKVIANKFHIADEKDAKENPEAAEGGTPKDDKQAKDEKPKKIMM